MRRRTLFDRQLVVPALLAAAAGFAGVWSVQEERNEQGTRPIAFASACHPSYEPQCLPVGRDVDCGELSGSVRVVGQDVYRLDRDGDGIGCE